MVIEKRQVILPESAPSRATPGRRIVLASASPRRRELTQAFSPPLEQATSAVEETPPTPRESPEHYVLRMSAAKAADVSSRSGGALVLGADTAVVLDGEVLGKPGSVDQATQMLASLRGRTHRVVTGVTVLDAGSGRRASAATCTDVTMRRYSDAEIASYVASGQPFDKAGAYGVQDEAFDPAESVEGCYLNVVGLPVCRVVSLLGQLGGAPRLKADWSPPERCLDCPLGRRTEVEGI